MFVDTLTKISDIASNASPPEFLMTLEDAKAHLRVDFDDDDYYIISLISVVKDTVEEMIWRSLLETEWRFTTQIFAFGVKLPRSPLIAIDSVKYRDTAGVETAVDSAEYWADVDASMLRWVDENTVNRYADALIIEYRAGFTTIPTSILQASKLILGHFYENREVADTRKTSATFEHLPVSAKHLLERYSERSYASW